MIVLEHASRWYGQVLGLNDVSCTIGPGITALLGPNGAGKSSMLKLVTGQLRPTTGKITVLGERPFANPRVLTRLGYCPEIENSADEMSGREWVTLLGSLGGLRPPLLNKRVDEVLEQVGMTAAAHRPIGGYSKGMRQRVKLAQAVVHNPDVVILDEPLNGLDPVGRRQVADLMGNLGARGKCVLVSSHILHEVEQLTQNLLLIHRGRLLAQGNVYEIRALIDRHPHRISITSPHGRRLAQRLLEYPFVLGVRFEDAESTRLEINTRQPDWFYHELPNLVLQEGYVVNSFSSPDNNLEAVFRYLVGE